MARTQPTAVAWHLRDGSSRSTARTSPGVKLEHWVLKAKTAGSLGLGGNRQRALTQQRGVRVCETTQICGWTRNSSWTTLWGGAHAQAGELSKPHATYARSPSSRVPPRPHSLTQLVAVLVVGGGGSSRNQAYYCGECIRALTPTPTVQLPVDAFL